MKQKNNFVFSFLLKVRNTSHYRETKETKGPFSNTREAEIVRFNLDQWLESSQGQNNNDNNLTL